MTLSKKCLVCGCDFFKPYSCSSNEWNNKRKYCSRSCYEETMVGKSFSPNTQFKKGHTSWLKGTKGIAKTNFGSFKKGQKLLEETKEKMKGRIPWNKGKIWIEKRGSNHPQWKGGITKLNHRIRTSSIYENWRDQVFRRDNYTCKQCGERCGNGRTIYLHAHHIKQFAEIMLENLIKTFEQAENCEQLWNINNGITFCRQCHYSNH